MKRVLDKLLTDNYKEVERYTHYFLSRLKSNLDCDTVINNAYLSYIEHDIKGKTPTLEHEVKYYFSHLIKCELLWQSKSKSEIITSVENDYISEVVDDENTNAIIIELNINRYKAIIDIYRESLRDKVKLIYFDTFLRLSKAKEKAYTIRELASHFDISVGTAHGMITEIKRELRELEQLLKN